MRKLLIIRTIRVDEGSARKTGVDVGDARRESLVK
jgi:hypothetical protein